MAETMKTHGAGTLRAADVGTEVTLAGWVGRRRDHGGVIFVDLRDASGIVQVVLNPDDAPASDQDLSSLRMEYCISVTGTVRPRPDDMANPELPTGEIEVVADKVLAARRLPNTTNISFQYIEGEGILLLLDRVGVAASSGSACTSGSLEPSHVLRAMGLPFTLTHGSIRFSLSRYNTQDEVDHVIKVLPPIIERLRMITPFNEQRATF